MRLSLLVVCSLLFKVAVGQVAMTGSPLPFSTGGLKNASTQLNARQSVYKVVYMPVWTVLLSPPDTIVSTTPIQQLEQSAVAADNNALQPAFEAQQTADLARAQAYFDALDDKAHTILVLDDIATKAEITEHPTYLSGRNFIFGTAVDATTQQIIMGYSPAAHMDFSDPTLAQNDKYLDEYASFLSSFVKGGGSGSVQQEVYPKGFPIVVVVVESTGYLHIDRTTGLTPQDLEDMKQSIRNDMKSLTDLVLMPGVYSFKKETAGLYHVVSKYVCKREKNSKFETYAATEPVRTWTLNNKPFDNSTKGSLLDLGDLSFQDGENTLVITTDLGNSYVKNKFNSTFEIKFNYNSEDYFLKVAIKGKKPVTVDPGVAIGSENGGGKLAVGDPVDLFLYVKSDDGGKLVEQAIWETSDHKTETANHHSLTITDGNNDVSVQAFKDANSINISFVYDKPPVKEIPYSFSRLNVAALKKKSDQKKATEMFAEALARIKTDDPDVYEYFSANDGMIQSYALRGSDNNLLLDGKPARGMTHKNYTYSHNYEHLDVVNVRKDNANIALDATLVQRIAGNDSITFLLAARSTSIDGKIIARPVLNKLELKDRKRANAIWSSILSGTLDDNSLSGVPLDEESIAILKKASGEKDEIGKNTVNPVIEKIAKDNPDMAARLRALVNDGTLTAEKLTEFYIIVPDDINILKTYTSLLDSKKLVYLNYDEIWDSQNEFTGVTIHEMMHIHHPCHNLLSALKWAKLREKKDIYKLEWGVSRCSAGDGHEVNNPEDSATCVRQQHYDPPATN